MTAAAVDHMPSLGVEKDGPWAVLIFDVCCDDETGQEWEEFVLLIGTFPSFHHAVAHPTRLAEHQKRVYVSQRHPEDPMYRKRVTSHLFVRDYDSPICKACGFHRNDKVHDAP